MRHHLTGLALCGACGFNSHQVTGDTAATDAPALDAPTEIIADAAVDTAVDGGPDAGPDAAPDGGGPSTPFPLCNPTDPHLVACYSLDGDVRDGSAHHLDASLVEVLYAAGKVGQALRLGPLSSVQVPDSPFLDVASVTVEAWINPLQLPEGNDRAFLVNASDQYGIFLAAQGQVGCSFITAQTVTAIGRIAAEEWHHVACTFDRSSAALYVDGALIDNARPKGMLSTKGSAGVSIGGEKPGAPSRYIGLIDEIRVLDVARTAAEICVDAGLSTCP